MPQWRNIGENLGSGVTGNFFCQSGSFDNGRIIPLRNSVRRETQGKTQRGALAGPSKAHIRTRGGSLPTLLGHAGLQALSQAMGPVWSLHQYQTSARAED